MRYVLIFDVWMIRSIHSWMLSNVFLMIPIQISYVLTVSYGITISYRRSLGRLSLSKIKRISIYSSSRRLACITYTVLGIRIMGLEEIVEDWVEQDGKTMCLLFEWFQMGVIVVKFLFDGVYTACHFLLVKYIHILRTSLVGVLDILFLILCLF